MYYKEDDLVIDDYVAYRGVWWNVTFDDDDEYLVLTRGYGIEVETLERCHDTLWRVATHSEREAADQDDMVLAARHKVEQQKLADDQATARSREALTASRETACTKVVQTLSKLSAAGHEGQVVDPYGDYSIGRIALTAGPIVVFYTTGKAALVGKRVPACAAKEIKELLRTSGWLVKS